MRKLLPIAFAVLLLSSCGGVSDPNLYYWGGYQNSTTAYEDLSYKSYKKQSPESLCALICAYEKMVNNPGGNRNVPPPGIYAEYGFFLLQPETAAAFINNATAEQRKVFGNVDFASTFNERGLLMLQKEIETYPESVKFIKPLLEKWSGQK